MSFYRRNSSSAPKPFNINREPQYFSTGYRSKPFNIPDAGFKPGSAPEYNFDNQNESPRKDMNHKPVKIPIKIVNPNTNDLPQVPRKDYPSKDLPPKNLEDQNKEQEISKDIEVKTTNSILHAAMNFYHEEILGYALNIEELKIKILREPDSDSQALKEYQKMARKFAELIYKIIEKLDIIENPTGDDEMHFKLSKKVILSTAMLWVERADKIQEDISEKMMDESTVADE